MKGRKPTLTVISGGAGRCPGPPGWLSDHGKAEWKRAAPRLHEAGRLTRGIMATLEAYCIAAGAVREAEETLIAEGRYVEGEKGKAPHPAFKVQMAAMREARLLAVELRLTREVSTQVNSDGNDRWAGLVG